VSLPEGVQAVTRPSGKTYYYAPHRGTKRAGKRVALGRDPFDPEFSRKLRGAQGAPSKVGTFSALILEYKASPKWAKHRPATKADYAIYLDRLDKSAGDRLVAALTVDDIYRMLDDMSATPVAANHMVAVLRTLIRWGIRRRYRSDNPAVGIELLDVEEKGAEPWPETAYRFVLEHAPVALCRTTFLGRATGQRAGDLVRMRPADLAADGIYLRIGKLREKEHFVPLSAEQMREIHSWDVADLDLFIKSATGRPLSAKHLGNAWRAWRKTKEAKPIAGLRMTLHGLRATAVADRRLHGTEDNGIANELGMSVQMVTRYSRFADKSAQARASRDRRERAQNMDLKTAVVDLKPLAKKPR
jgi:integrase